jgi:putative endonuclease
VDKRYYVYILASSSAVLYVGMTNGLARRIRQHKEKLVPGFTQKYHVDRLVHYEAFDDVRSAITREKRIKGWRRQKKIALIETTNPRWIDLSAEWLK